MNNRADRALRLAVIAHKVSHCSSNVAGAQVFATFTSVACTLAKQNVDSLGENLCHLFRGPTVQAPPSCSSPAFNPIIVID